MVTFNIEDFFSKRFENESTNILLEKPAYFSATMMEDYVYQLMSYSLDDYISYIAEHPNKTEITSRDITQLSNIDDCTTNMCRIMLENDNRGLTLTDIATKLHGDDNFKDNTVALTKYGENQVKTACQMGLTVFKNDLWYLTGIGYIINNLPEKVQAKYYAINLLRDSFYSKIILSLQEKDTNLRDFMSILSESTQKRRSSSCQKVLAFYIKQCQVENISLNNLSFK